MTRARVAAALAALITAQLLQATLVAPVTLPVPVSLSAVLVAAIALTSGPGTAMAFGFAAGLLADLASRHPAGVLALCWLGVGLLAGRFADPYADGPDLAGLAVRRRGVRLEIAVAAVSASLAGLAATVVLLITGSDGTTSAGLFAHTAAALLGNLVIAAAVVPLVRFVTRSRVLRRPAPMPRLALTPDGSMRERIVTVRHG